MTDYRIDDFKDLIVWKRAMELAKAAYVLTGKLPRNEDYSLTDQIRRAAISVPSNIAEGYGRTSQRDYARFLAMARGSSYELETQVLLCIEIGYIREEDTFNVLGLCKEIAKMITKILKSLENR